MKPTSTTSSSSSNESAENNSGKLPCKKLVSVLADVGVMQQPTKTARNQSQPAAFLVGSVVGASLSNLYPGLLTDPLAWVIQQNSGLAPRTFLQGVVGKERANMLLTRNKKTKQRAVLTPQGPYTAVVKSVTFKAKKEGTEGPGTVELEFTLNELNQHVTRAYPAKLEGRSPLLRDYKSIVNRGLTREEDEQGFDPAILEGRNCRLHIAHRLDHNGRPHSQTITVMAAESTPVAAAPAAVEAVAAVTA